MRRRLAGLLAGVFLLLGAGEPDAHSILLDSSPAAGTTVPPPVRITFRFNNRIEKRLSRVVLVDPQETRHDLAVLVGEGPPDTLAVLVPPLGPGRYRVEWQVLSADGHVVSGRVPFQVLR